MKNKFLITLVLPLLLVGCNNTTHSIPTDESGDYLGKYAFVDGCLTEKTTQLKCYYTASNASQVAFFEFRCNSVAYKGKQAYNVGIGSCNIKSWERV